MSESAERPDRCATCRFFDDKGKGSCRRYAPRSGDTTWPQVFSWEWCGEWLGIKTNDAQNQGNVYIVTNTGTPPQQ